VKGRLPWQRDVKEVQKRVEARFLLRNPDRDLHRPFPCFSSGHHGCVQTAGYEEERSGTEKTVPQTKKTVTLYFSDDEGEYLAARRGKS